MAKSCFHCAWSGSFDINELWCKNKESVNYNKKVKHQGHCEKWTKFVYTSKDDIRPGQLALIKEKEMSMQSQSNSYNELICPHCGYIDIDGYDYFDDLDTEETIVCIKCNMTFFASTETVYHIRK